MAQNFAVSRRAMLGGAIALCSMPAQARQQDYARAPLPGTTLDPTGDDSGRIVPAPPADYWPFFGISGPGRPATAADVGKGWVSGLPNVRYGGPEKPSYPVAPWNNAAAGSAVTAGLLPALRPIHRVHIRDTIVKPGPDGWYYMTGSTGDNVWAFTDGIELYRSRDLKRWEYRGLIWSIEKDGTWERGWRMRKGVPFRAIWAPEIHYIRGNWYLVHCMSRAGHAVLRSTSGKAEGPYVHAFSADKPFSKGIDPTLFEDDDGSVWFTSGSAQSIVRLEDDLSGPAGDWQPMTATAWDSDPKHHTAGCARNNFADFGFEGATMFKRGGRYYLACCDDYDGRYSFAVWMSDKPTGPWRDRHEVPDCGGGNFFRDFAGNWWVTYFGNREASPFREMPGLARIDFDADGKVVFTRKQPFATRPFEPGMKRR